MNLQSITTSASYHWWAIPVVIGAGVYLFMHVRMAWHIKPTPKGNAQPLTVSIVVAARNEAATIEACIQALLAQTQPIHEIVIIDDGSADDTVDRAMRYAANAPHLHVMTSDGRGKKMALDQAVRATTGDVILLTDADCTPSPKWAATMIKQFAETVGVVAGLAYRTTKLPKRYCECWEWVDVQYLSAAIAATIAQGNPCVAWGGSLAYRRAAYDAVGGYKTVSQIASGDDTLMLIAIASRTDWQAAAVLDADARVAHPFAASWSQLWQQRKRYATTNVHVLRTNLKLRIFNIGQMLLFVGMLATLILPHPIWALSAWGCKIIGDLVVLIRISRFDNQQRCLLYAPIWSVLHPGIWLTATTMGFFGRFSWRNRPHHAGLQQNP